MHKTAEFETGWYEQFDSYSPDDDETTYTRIERKIIEAADRWRNNVTIRRTIACLSTLDDRQLADIGISFDQIPEAARRAVEQPKARDTRTFRQR